MGSEVWERGGRGMSREQERGVGVGRVGYEQGTGEGWGVRCGSGEGGE